MSTMRLSWSEQKRMLTAEEPVFPPCRPTFLRRCSQFCCLLAVPFLLTTVVMHWKREPKSHYISLAVAVAAESHYSSLTVSKRAAELVFAEHPRSPTPHHAPLAGNCLILQQAGGETAATPVHVSLSWVGVGFGVTHKCCLGSSRGAPPEARQRHISSARDSPRVWMPCERDRAKRGAAAMREASDSQRAQRFTPVFLF